MFNKIKIRITVANKCYFGINNAFRSKQVSLKLKTTLYKTIIKPNNLVHVQDVVDNQNDKEKIAILEKIVLKRIYKPKKNNIRQKYKKKYIEF